MEQNLQTKTKKQKKQVEEKEKQGNTIQKDMQPVVHPSVEESDAAMSDCFSTASTASEAPKSQRKRQPIARAVKGGNKKLTTVNPNAVDPVLAPASRAKIHLPTFEDIQEELRVESTVDINARIKECMSTVENVAESSRNLKITYVNSLRKVARTVQVAIEELAQRSSVCDVARLEKENGELRTQLASLEAKFTVLTEEVISLRSGDLGTTERSVRSNGSRFRSGNDPLLQEISELIDKKLVDFREHYISKKIVTLPSRNKSESMEDLPSQSTQTTRRSGKRTAEKVANDTQSLQTVVPDSPLVCPLPEPSSSSSWALVVGRKVKKSKTNVTKGSQQQIKKQGKQPRMPRNAAITLTVTENSTARYGDIMAAARERVRLEDCGISEVRPKRAVNGGFLLEVLGTDSDQKADALAERLRIALADMPVKIARPVKTGEVRVMDLDESITQQEIAAAVAEAGNCSIEDIKVGEIRFNPFRLGTVWVRCPLSVIGKFAEDKHLRVGWIRARVQVLAARKLQCYRCLEMGHVRQQCQSKVDRSSCCYKCSELGHKARECTARALKCPVCKDLGLSANHRLGSEKCIPPNKKKNKGRVQAPLSQAMPSTSAQLASQSTQENSDTQNSQNFGFSRAT